MNSAESDRGSTNHDQSISDEASLANYALQLGDGIDEYLGAWMKRLGEATLTASGIVVTGEVGESLDALVEREVPQVVAQVRLLLNSDIDDQRSNPLAIIRQLLVPLTQFLDDHGASRPRRDADAVRLHPADLFDLVPGGFVDIDPSLHTPGIVWGAAKAHVHLRRRRAEGQR